MHGVCSIMLCSYVCLFACGCAFHHPVLNISTLFVDIISPVCQQAPLAWCRNLAPARPELGRKKGGLTVGAVLYVVVCDETPGPIFCVRGAFLLKAHFVS